MSAKEQFQPFDVAALDDAFAAQRKAYKNMPYANASIRKARLAKLKALLLDNEAAIIAALDADFGGRAAMDTRIGEFLPCVMGINETSRHLGRWMKARHKFAPLVFQPLSAKVVPQPVGVVGVIAPWNYPLTTSIGPVISALAAGNHVMVKMSEFTPATGHLLAQLAPNYFEPGVLTFINGELDMAQAFSQLPFDHILFTGSSAVGKHIMRAASANLTPVTLELGGKSPVVIDRSIPITEAAERLVFPKCVNAGQTCVAPDYVLCPEESVDSFVQHYLNEVRRQHGAELSTETYTSVINERQRDRLLAHLEDAKAKGAKLHIAGESDDLSSYGNRLPPILLTDVTDDMTVMQDEIFGPILPVMPYKTLQQTLDYINARPRPLALYVFGYDQALRPLFSRETHSGALVFNDALIHVGIESLPFGGIGNSGMGSYHGSYGFETFSHLKPVVSKQRLSTLKLIYPPYKHWILNLIFKLFVR